MSGHDVGDRRAGRAAGEGRRAADRSRRRRCSRCRRSWRRCTTATRTGRGQYIDTSLSKPAWRCRSGKRPSTFAGGGVPQPMGSAHRMSAPYQAIRCADGYITLAAANDRLFDRLCGAARASGVGGTIPTSPTTPRRVRNRAALAALIEAVTLRPAARALARRCSTPTAFRAGRSTTTRRCSPIRRCGARRWWSRPITRRSAGSATLGSPIKMSATPPVVGRRAPLLGEHTGEVLREAGFSDEEIARLKKGQSLVKPSALHCSEPTPLWTTNSPFGSYLLLMSARRA